MLPQAGRRPGEPRPCCTRPVRRSGWPERRHCRSQVRRPRNQRQPAAQLVLSWRVPSSVWPYLRAPVLRPDGANLDPAAVGLQRFYRFATVRQQTMLQVDGRQGRGQLPQVSRRRTDLSTDTRRRPTGRPARPALTSIRWIFSQGGFPRVSRRAAATALPARGK